jgi:hypothetical protein
MISLLYFGLGFMAGGTVAFLYCTWHVHRMTKQLEKRREVLKTSPAMENGEVTLRRRKYRWCPSCQRESQRFKAGPDITPDIDWHP